MTIQRIFLAYMALVGLASGALLVLAPQTGEFFIKPYFWVLIAVAVFEGGAAIYRKSSPIEILTTPVRFAGFAIGCVLMLAVPTLAGSPAHFV
jgi:hypothetical protein